MIHNKILYPSQLFIKDLQISETKINKTENLNTIHVSYCLKF